VAEQVRNHLLELVKGEISSKKALELIRNLFGPNTEKKLALKKN
jgi:hypothetical protein